jgi:uncharacterized OsmC-like protein
MTLLDERNRVMSKQTNLNGVNTEKLFETIEAIKQTPSLATFRFRNHNRWIDGALNRSEICSFYGAGQEDTTRTKGFLLDNDEAPVLLGEDRGPNPVENLLHALAGCMTTSLVYHAAAKGIEVEEVESRFEGDLDLQGFLGLRPDIRNGYEEIRVTFRVKADATEEQIEELVRVAQERSPVFDVVTNGTCVKVGCEAVTPEAVA